MAAQSPHSRVPGEAQLPSGWAETKDSYGRTYFLHRESGHSCWVRPVAVQLPWKFRDAATTLGHLLSRGMNREWVRITLEADEDRVKLFTALYHLVLEDVTKERYEEAGLNNADQEALPTLAACHKRARALKIKVKDYALFLERAVRGLPIKVRDLTTQSPAAAATSQDRPKTPGSCKSCKSGRHFHFEPMVETTSPTPGSLSLAEYGSLQAQQFRAKRAQEMETALDMKRAAEGHFGSPRHEGSRTPKAALPSIRLVKKDETGPVAQPASPPVVLRVVTSSEKNIPAEEVCTPPEEDDHLEDTSHAHEENEDEAEDEETQTQTQTEIPQRRPSRGRPQPRQRQRQRAEVHEDEYHSDDDGNGDALAMALAENERYRARIKQVQRERDDAMDELAELRENLTEQLERERIERAALTRELHTQRQQFQKVLQDQRNSQDHTDQAAVRLKEDGETKGAGEEPGLGLDYAKSELLDAKVTISRMTQRCKRLENELSRMRAQAQAQHSPASHGGDDHVQDALMRFKTAQDRLVESEEEVSTLSLHADELQRQLREAEQGRAKASQEALELRLDRDQALAALKQKHSDEMATVKRSQALELAQALCSAKEHYRANLEAQREKFVNQGRMLEEQLQARLRAQSKSHVDALAQLRSAHESSLQEAVEEGRKREREHSEEALADADAIHQAWAAQTRRRGAVALLNSVWSKSRFVALGHAFAVWTRVLERDRANELVEVYGAAIDQTAAGARIALVWAKVLSRAMALAFSKWRTRATQGLGVDPVRPALYQKEPLYPGELRRKLRRRLKHQRMFGEIDRLCDGLEVNTNGKVEPRSFHRALLQREVAWHKLGREFDGALMAAFVPENRRSERRSASKTQQMDQPSDDWRLGAGVAIQRLDALAQRRNLLLKSKAWTCLKRTTTAPRGAPRLGDFMRNMETEALQEEVRALHVQLGASKAEAWKYKRKLLANYLR
ncbi:Hypothetical Protein FCC1311_012262 [Hondaea fermentalgiana]|uniref:WW domain-containing protein n=1 Tax=Hondaea fermentalgiana TaxID=2315210 RepID=A0A2R5G3X2_9STRA|nr:Hypothetical Protein FCC1311_012262 [Hondaea fermentalgiana]|eukprot:GBG25009.1 Hypothetical Protein FCC1311_012262 [Hondaea fermentalgiana]